ncbi:Imm43 family immunity protein [Shewanella woodyi]|uniref:Imm43 family immunity protein n=1 Tax=Shewanella woodyi TaxID=60961 RepID=UPI0007EBB081|nr:Imm43 family immunity protein [Shewanella woodyi]
MNNTYFALMNDNECESQPVFLSGVLDIKDGAEIPINGSILSFPWDAYITKNEVIFWNFNKDEELLFDYRSDHGHIVSGQFLELLEGFLGAAHRVKKLVVWMNGKKIDYNYYYIAFDHGSWDNGIQLNTDLLFYDKNESIFKRGVRGGIVPTGDIVLTVNAKKFDFFQLLETSSLFDFFIVNEKIKENIDAMEFKGVKVVPLNDAFNTYCKDFRISIDSLLPKVKSKRKLP